MPSTVPMPLEGHRDLPRPLAFYGPVVAEEIEFLFQDRKDPLSEMMRHQLGWDRSGLTGSGKYLRPTLCLWACSVAGGDWRQALPAAVALELLHNFSLIHDDIQDQSPSRRGRPTVWALWGANQALNAGDAMYALSRLTLLDLDRHGIPWERISLSARLLDLTCLVLCEGQYLDLDYQSRSTVAPHDYIEMVSRKTAALFGCALEMGAILALGPGQTSDDLREVGRALGMAYQMRDDGLDLWGGEETGKEVAQDLRSKKKSLPVVYGLSKNDTLEGRRLIDIYEQSTLSEGDVKEVQLLLQGLGAREFCALEAMGWKEKALAILGRAGVSDDGLREMEEVAGFLVGRAY